MRETTLLSLTVLASLKMCQRVHQLVDCGLKSNYRKVVALRLRARAFGSAERFAHRAILCFLFTPAVAAAVLQAQKIN